MVGVDPSEAFVAHAGRRSRTRGRRSSVGRRRPSTGLADGAVDAVVSGLVLNFVPDLGAALDEAQRVTRPGGSVAGYVWDYADGMELLRRFWDAAVALDPSAAGSDEGVRFPAAAPGPLAAAFTVPRGSRASRPAIDVRRSSRASTTCGRRSCGDTGPAPTLCRDAAPAGA